MSVETDPVPPVPSTTPPINKKDKREPFDNIWTQWFIQLRDKINIINALIVNFSGITGNGFIVLQNSINWFTRTLQQGTGISISNADGTAGDPTISHGDTSSVADLTSNNSGTVVIQDFSITFDTFGHVQTVSVGTVDTATALGGTFQPLDATLTALSGQNWAANALPIGTGADTVSQVSFAANTFPARSSAGNLEAKTITDFGLSLVDDANAAAARSTLGLDSGTYTPTLTNVTNVASSTASVCQYLRIGSVVTVSGRIDATPTAGGGTLSRVDISLPVASDFTLAAQCAGAGSFSQSTGITSAQVIGDTTNNRAIFQFNSNVTTSTAGLFTFMYVIV